MAWRTQKEPIVIQHLGMFMVVCSLCHCAVLTRHRYPASSSIVWNLKMGKDLTSAGEGGSTAEAQQGRLVIGRSLRLGAMFKETLGLHLNNSTEIDRNFQSDMGWSGAVNPQDQDYDLRRPASAAVERLMAIDPKVECTGDSMKLKIQDHESIPGSLFFVDRGNRLTPLPITKLPPSCGYNMKTTLRDLVLVAPYNGCFVTLEEDRYVLPLLWWDLPLRMSCPVMRQSAANPPLVSCHAAGMVLKMDWAVSVHKIKVKLSGQWEPLMKIAPKCGFSVVAHPEGVVITAHFATCVEMKDGMFTLELSGEGEIKVSCPPQSMPEATQDSPEMAGTGDPPAPPQNPNPPFLQFPQYPPPQPQGPYFPFYPEVINPGTPPMPEVPGVQYGQQTPPTSVPPMGLVNHQFNPFPFYFWQSPPDVQPAEWSPTTPPDVQPAEPPQATQPTQSQVKLTYTYPFYTNPTHPTWKPAEQPKDTAPGQEMPPLLFPYYPQPAMQASLPTQKTVTSAAYQFGQENQPFYQFPLYPQPPASEVSKGETQQPLYPYYLPLWPEGHPQGPMLPDVTGDKLEPSYPQYPVPSQPHERPASSTHEAVQWPLNPYPFGPLTDGKWQPIQEQASAKEPPESAKEHLASASEGLPQMPKIPQSKPGSSPFPQVGTLQNPLVQCPQSCPPGVSNCCPQILFHQHLHHFAPSGIKGAVFPPFYHGHAFLTALGYTGFSTGTQPTNPPVLTLNPTKATPTSAGKTVASAPESSQVLGNYWGYIESQPNEFGRVLAMQSYQPPPDVRPGPNFVSYPSQPTEPDVLPYNANNPLLPYSLQDTINVDLQSHAHSNTASTPQTVDGEPLQSMLQYYLLNSQAIDDPHSQSPSDVKMPNPLNQPHLMSNFLKYLQQLHITKQNELKATKLQQGNHQLHQDQGKSLDPQTVPYYMLQDSQIHISKNVPTRKSKSLHLQVSVENPKMPAEPKLPLQAQSNAYVLLQQGPPGSGPRRQAASPQQGMPLENSGSKSNLKSGNDHGPYDKPPG